MGRGANNRVLLTLVVTSLVLFSGCAAVDDSSTTPVTTESDDIEPTNEPITTTTTAEPDTTTTAASDTTATTDRYVFAAGETYTYTLLDQDRQFVWRVADVSGSDVSAEILLDGTNGKTASQTYNGTQTESGNTLFTDDSTTIPVFGTLHNAATATHNHSLTVGASWTVTRDTLPGLFGFSWEKASVEVTGTGSHSGTSYHNVTITPENRPDISATFGVNQNYPFALSWSSTGTATAIDTGVLVLQSVDRRSRADPSGFQYPLELSSDTVPARHA